MFSNFSIVCCVRKSRHKTKTNVRLVAMKMKKKLPTNCCSFISCNFSSPDCCRLRGWPIKMGAKILDKFDRGMRHCGLSAILLSRRGKRDYLARAHYTTLLLIVEYQHKSTSANGESDKPKCRDSVAAVRAPACRRPFERPSRR